MQQSGRVLAMRCANLSAGHKVLLSVLRPSDGVVRHSAHDERGNAARSPKNNHSTEK